MRLLHLSDPHFGTERPQVVDALYDLSHRLELDGLLISGDLTQRATAAQFDACAHWIEALPRVPTLLMPGNHDIPLWDLWRRLRAPYGRYERRFGERPSDGLSCLDLPGVRVIGVDTTRWWRHQHGSISSNQIMRCAALLEQAPAGTWRIVMSHHPLVARHAHDRAERPRHHAEALQRWRAAGIDLLLSGHLHEPALLPLLPPEGASGASADAPLWQAQAGSVLSRRLAPGTSNSLQVLIQADGPPGGPALRRWLRYDFDDERREFTVAEARRLKRD